MKELYNNYKSPSERATQENGYPRRRSEREGNREPFKEINDENLNLGKEMDIQAQKANRTPNYLNEKDLL